VSVRLLACGALAIAAGCAGLSPATPPAAPATGAAMPAGINPRDPLTYVADDGPPAVVYIYDFLSRVGKLTGFSDVNDLCIDHAQNVYVADRGANKLYEYKHAGTGRIETIADTAGSLFDCAADAVTGDLAATNDVTNSGSRPGNVLVYAGGSGMPKQYGIANLWWYDFAAYDASGNLFVDGLTAKGAGLLAELPRGGSAFKVLAVNAAINPGSMQWDGHYLAIVDLGAVPNEIDRFAISGSRATKTGAMVLKDDTYVASFFISTSGTLSELAATNGNAHDEGLYVYPKSGKAALTIGRFANPLGTVISNAP
jgi:hypothetical protein